MLDKSWIKVFQFLNVTIKFQLEAYPLKYNSFLEILHIVRPPSDQMFACTLIWELTIVTWKLLIYMHVCV